MARKVHLWLEKLGLTDNFKSGEEYEIYGALCEECHEIKIDELDFENDYGF